MCVRWQKFHLIQFPRISTGILQRKFGFKSIWDVRQLEMFALYRAFHSLSVSRSELFHEAFPSIHSCLPEWISPDLLFKQGHTDCDIMIEVFIYFFLDLDISILFFPTQCYLSLILHDPTLPAIVLEYKVWGSQPDYITSSPPPLRASVVLIAGLCIVHVSWWCSPSSSSSHTGCSNIYRFIT